MCGIYFTQSNLKIKKFDINKSLKKIYLSLKNNSFENLLYEIRLLRNNTVFVNLINEKKNKIKTKISYLLIKIKQKKNIIDEDLFQDLIWVLKEEILNKSEKIKKVIEANKLTTSQNEIIFIVQYLNSIESLNYLETRGRDSASLSFNFKTTSKIDLNETFGNSKEISFFQKQISKNNFIFNITIKYANSIGYSGENLSKIKNKIEDIKFLSKINFSSILGFFIVGHTRWASVGSVNINNCHPLIDKHKNNVSFFYMNGDITNSNDIIKNKKNKNNFYLQDKKCTNDLSSLPSLKYNNTIKISEINGSYVLLCHGTENPEELLIWKKGSQGLYFSEDNDSNLILCSDVYGIVNSNNQFKRISKNQSFILKPFSKSKIKIKKVKKHKTILSTKDLSKNDYSRFFIKEVHDTQSFIKRTIREYIDFKKNKIKNADHFFSPRLLDLLRNHRIKNIIITGMGSCYTAGVGITKYLNNQLFKNKIFGIKVQACIASEGSGFYLSDNMDDTIVLVIAQSGTTIDTNVFAGLAKKRGAHTLAIVNKRDGDITYIVENTLYLGNGRDVELSVPSTKTYTCHLLLGFIVSEKILSTITKKKLPINFFKTLNNINKKDLLDLLIKKQSTQINKIKFDVFKYTKWIIVYDDSNNAYSSLEFRIKLSECCYKSVSYMHLNTFKNANLNNCLVFYVGQNNIYSNKTFKNNFLIQISKTLNFRKTNLISLTIKNKDDLLLSLESAVAIQLLSYKISKLIDDKRVQVKKIKNLKNIENFLFSIDQLNKYKKLSRKNKIFELTNKLKRPLDSIKHQAKTITVGAIREDKEEKNNLLSYKIKPIKKNIFHGNIKRLKNNINLMSNDSSDIEKYYFVNIIENYNFEFKKKLFYNFLEKSNLQYVENSSNLFFGDIKNNDISNFNIKKIKADSYSLLKSFMINSKSNLIKNEIFEQAKIEINQNVKKYMFNFEYYIKRYNNVKFLGSGINYLVAKKFAQKFSVICNKTIGYDVIENHKHIDISSEPLVIIFASNIYRKGFQKDILAEVEKFIAHNNNPIIFTNSGTKIYDDLKKIKMGKIKLIKLPYVDELFSLPFFEFYFKYI